MTQPTPDAAAALFEQHRPQLRAVAYRLLGSVGDAEDAVQEAWLRLARSDQAAIENLAAWLTTVVGRIGLDMLRARAARHEEYFGTRLPEPVIEDDERSDPEKAALVSDSVGLALLVVLDTLRPAERVSFVLHDMFAVGYDEIAALLERSPEAARQLASRARRQVQDARVDDYADVSRQREIVTAFLAASRDGDFAALVRLLDPQASYRVDPGPLAWVGPTRFEGAEAVAAHAMSTESRRYAKLCVTAWVNGTVGIVVRTRVGVIGAAGFAVAGGRIVALDLVLDPAKLARAV